MNFFTKLALRESKKNSMWKKTELMLYETEWCVVIWRGIMKSELIWEKR